MATFEEIIEPLDKELKRKANLHTPHLLQAAGNLEWDAFKYYLLLLAAATQGKTDKATHMEAVAVEVITHAMLAESGINTELEPFHLYRHTMQEELLQIGYIEKIGKEEFKLPYLTELTRKEGTLNPINPYREQIKVIEAQRKQNEEKLRQNPFGPQLLELRETLNEETFQYFLALSRVAIEQGGYTVTRQGTMRAYERYAKVSLAEATPGEAGEMFDKTLDLLDDLEREGAIRNEDGLFIITLVEEKLEGK